MQNFSPDKAPHDLHVAIILDGNRRWGRKNNKEDSWGHYKGAQVLKRIVKKCPQLGIKYLTIFAFSTENWKRSPEEIRFLMNLIEVYLKKEKLPLHKKNVRLRFLGERHRFSENLLHHIQEIEHLTQDNTGLQLNVALDYGGRREIVTGIRRLVMEIQKCALPPDAITEDLFEKFLFTYPHPHPDILIRTGGESRISNYLLWQLAYTELFFLSVQWPDFIFQHLKEIVKKYHTRTRTYGGNANV